MAIVEVFFGGLRKGSGRFFGDGGEGGIILGERNEEN